MNENDRGSNSGRLIPQSIQEKFGQAEPQAKIHEDIDLSLQAVRDHLDDDVEEVITDTKKSQSELYRFVKNIAPEYASKIKLYEGPCDMFQFFPCMRFLQSHV